MLKKYRNLTTRAKERKKGTTRVPSGINRLYSVIQLFIPLTLNDSNYANPHTEASDEHAKHVSIIIIIYSSIWHSIVKRQTIDFSF